ncbi:MAG: glycosyltransferase family 4 protein [Saprospiraceae bacterium]
MRPTLVILTDNFGLNFSGGAIATCRIFVELETAFKEIIVVGKQLGVHPFQQLKFRRYDNRRMAIRTLRQLATPTTIFYGDFYMSYYFILAKLPFYFTYHDNWPEQGQFGWQNALRAWYYVPLYRWIIRRAAWTITVSNFKYEFIRKISPCTSVIRNGINMRITKNAYEVYQPKMDLRILMSGNIDDRKFAWALALFQKIKKGGELSQIQFHLYGKVLDENLAQQLAAFDFVTLAGFQLDIDFSNFDLYCCTSKIENLSIAVCEALCNYTPVLSFDVGGLKEVIAAPSTGILIPPGDIEAFYQALKKISSGQLRFDFSQQDLSEYDWAFAAKAYHKILFKNINPQATNV